MTQFDPISHKTLEEIVQHLKSSSCCLDTLPTGFSKNVFDCMASDLLQIVNTSLVSSYFPQACKNAAFKRFKNRIISLINKHSPILIYYFK